MGFYENINEYCLKSVIKSWKDTGKGYLMDSNLLNVIYICSYEDLVDKTYASSYKDFSPFNICSGFFIVWMSCIITTATHLTNFSAGSPVIFHQTSWMLLVQISWFLLIGGKMSDAFKQKNYFYWEFYNFFCWWRLNGKNVTLSCIFQKKLSSNKKVNFQLSPLCILILFGRTSLNRNPMKPDD